MAGNWKMNLHHLEAIALVQKLAFTLTLVDADRLLLGTGHRTCRRSRNAGPTAGGARTAPPGATGGGAAGC